MILKKGQIWRSDLEVICVEVRLCYSGRENQLANLKTEQEQAETFRLYRKQRGVLLGVAALGITDCRAGICV